jgi:Fic family protein
VDGNGRTSRLLMNHILAYHNKPLAIVFKEDRIDYINALEESRNLETTNLFKEFMYDQQKKYFQQEIDNVQNEIFVGPITKNNNGRY